MPVEISFNPDGGTANIDGIVLFPVTLQAIADEWFDGVHQGSDGAWYQIVKPGRKTFIIWHNGNAVFQTHEKPVSTKHDEGTITYTWKGAA